VFDSSSLNVGSNVDETKISGNSAARRYKQRHCWLLNSEMYGACHEPKLNRKWWAKDRVVEREESGAIACRISRFRVLSTFASERALLMMCMVKLSP
jgi:hypothetical protein